MSPYDVDKDCVYACVCARKESICAPVCTYVAV